MEWSSWVKLHSHNWRDKIKRPLWIYGLYGADKWAIQISPYVAFVRVVRNWSDCTWVVGCADKVE